MQPNPLMVTAATANSRPQHSLPNHRQKTTSMRAAQRTGPQEAVSVPFLKSEPITYLVGCSNEAPVIVDGQRETTLIDSGAQVLSISFQFCEDLTLQIQLLGRLLELEGMGGSAIPYLGYVKINVQIPGINNYNEDVLLLAISATTYSKKVPVMVGSKILNQAMGVTTKGELVKATMTWKQAHFGPVMSRSLQLPYTSSSRTWVEKEAIHSSLWINTVEVKEICLDDVWAQFTLHRGLLSLCSVLSVYMAIPVSGDTVCGFMCLQSQLQPPPQLPTSVVLTVTYGELHSGSSQVPIYL